MTPKWAVRVMGTIHWLTMLCQLNNIPKCARLKRTQSGDRAGVHHGGQEPKSREKKLNWNTRGTTHAHKLRICEQKPSTRDWLTTWACSTWTQKHSTSTSNANMYKRNQNQLKQIDSKINCIHRHYLPWLKYGLQSATCVCKELDSYRCFYWANRHHRTEKAPKQHSTLAHLLQLLCVHCLIVALFFFFEIFQHH